MDIMINSIPYTIDDIIWDKHLEMHPVRPEEALKSSLFLVYGEKRYDVSEIEKLINDEYELSLNFGNVVLQAEKIYLNKYAKQE